MVIPFPISEDVSQDFYALVSLPDAEGCMTWLGRMVGSYPQFQGRSAREVATRVYFGERSFDAVKTSCRRKDCLAPDHLVVT